MNLTDVKAKYKNYTPKNATNPTKVAVMILLATENDKTYVLFEKRSNIVSQPGDISFVGGHIEDGETAEDAAIREATEELNIKKENLKIISEADYFITINNRQISSFVAELVDIKINEIKPNEEVEKLIAIPLDALLNAEKQTYVSEFGKKSEDDFPYHLIQGQKNYKFAKMKEYTYFYTLGETVIWGFTAKILSAFLDNLKK